MSLELNNGLELDSGLGFTGFKDKRKVDYIT